MKILWKKQLGRVLSRGQFRGLLLRPLFWCVFVVLGLAHVSYHWIYAHPSQIQARARHAVARWTGFDENSDSILVEGGQHGWSEGTSIDRVRIGSAVETGAGSSGQGSWSLELRNTRVTSNEDFVGAPGREFRSRSHGAPLPLWHVTVGELFGDRPLGEAGVRGILGPEDLERIAALSSTTPFQIRVRDASWILDRHRDPLELRNLRIRGIGLEGIVADAELVWPRYWDQGYCELAWRPVLNAEGSDTGGRGFEVRLRLENANDVLICNYIGASALGDAFERLEPAGKWNVDARWPGASTGGWDLRLEHFDTSLTLPAPIAAKVEHLRGRMRLEEDRVVIEGNDLDDEIDGRIWGLDCKLSGTLGTRATSQFRLRVPKTPLQLLQPRFCPTYVRGILEHLEPRGDTAGEVKAESGSWTGNFDLLDISIPSVADLALASGKLMIQKSLDGGEGRFTLKRLSWANYLGTLSGDLSVKWDARELVLEGKKLVIETGNSNAGASKNGASHPGGTASFNWSIDRATHRGQGQGSWKGLSIASSFVSAESVSGEFRHVTLPAEREGPAETVHPADTALPADTVSEGISKAEDEREYFGGTFELQAILLPKAGASGESLSFDSGFLSWEYRKGRFDISLLHLVASNKTLRAYGRIERDGRIDLLLMIVHGERASALADLGRSTDVAEWVSSIDNRDMTTWRLVGHLSDPRARSVDTYEFVHHYSERG